MGRIIPIKEAWDGHRAHLEILTKLTIQEDMCLTAMHRCTTRSEPSRRQKMMMK